MGPGAMKYPGRTLALESPTADACSVPAYAAIRSATETFTPCGMLEERNTRRVAQVTVIQLE